MKKINLLFLLVLTLQTSPTKAMEETKQQPKQVEQVKQKIQTFQQDLSRANRTFKNRKEKINLLYELSRTDKLMLYGEEKGIDQRLDQIERLGKKLREISKHIEQHNLDIDYEKILTETDNEIKYLIRQ